MLPPHQQLQQRLGAPPRFCGHGTEPQQTAPDVELCEDEAHRHQTPLRLPRRQQPRRCAEHPYAVRHEERHELHEKPLREVGRLLHHFVGCPANARMIIGRVERRRTLLCCQAHIMQAQMQAVDKHIGIRGSGGVAQGDGLDVNAARPLQWHRLVHRVHLGEDSVV